MKKELYGIITGIIAMYPIQFSKMMHFKVKNDEYMKMAIRDNNLYHFTNSKCVNKILDSGYIKPSSIIGSHLTMPKAYMYCGLPSIETFRKNVLDSYNPFLNEIYEWDVIKIVPDEDTIKNLKVRSLNDNVIVKNGKLVLPENKLQYIESEEQKLISGASREKIVIDIDEEGKLLLGHFDEKKHKFEVVEDLAGNKNRKYIPDKKIIDILNKERENNTQIKESFTQYGLEKKFLFNTGKKNLNNIKNFILSNIKDKFSKFFRNKDKKLLLNKSKENFDYNCNEGKMNLADMVYTNEEKSNNELKRNKEEKEKIQDIQNNVQVK